MTLLLSLACSPSPPAGMVYVKAGVGPIGAPSELPDDGPGFTGVPPRERRQVHLDAYFIDQTEVTQAAYARFLADTGYRIPHAGGPYGPEFDWTSPTPPNPDHPVVLVSWYDAVEYCAWAKKRLPTDAEWERAALGWDGRRYPWGDTYSATAVNDGIRQQPMFDASDGYRATSPVGAFPGGRSPLGRDDAFGNAWEWTSDVLVDSWDDMQFETDGDVLVNPRAEQDSIFRIVRGGSYYFDLDALWLAERWSFVAEGRRKTAGFRCAMDASR